MVGLLIDITIRKQTQGALRNLQERQRLKTIIDSLSEGLLIVAPEGELLLMNPAARQICKTTFWRGDGEDRHEVVELFELRDLEDRAIPTEDGPLARALRGEEYQGCEAQVLQPGSGARWIVSFGAVSVKDVIGRLMFAVITIRDVTAERLAAEDIRKANASLHHLSSQLLRLQDEERKRIARELHDGTVQVLTGLAMNILLIGQSPAAKDDPEVQGLIAESLALAKQCSRELRTLSYRLHPPELEGLGLVFALRSWAEGFGTRAGIRVDVELDDPGRLAPEVETALFRIAQEALGNVQRHSGSPTANLRLIARDREIQLEVEDAGQGFPPGVLERDGSGLQRVGVGILGMRERARQLGGSLQIRCDGSQTTVRVVLPREVTQ